MSKDMKARQAAVAQNARSSELLALRKSGVIDRATFRMIARQKGLPCARQAITSKNGNRVPQEPKFMNAEGVETTTNWTKVGEKPAVRFTK